MNGKTDILIVEDSATQREQLRSILERGGFNVRTAADGNEAIAALGARAPTVVIADIIMPGMDGYALCRRIKEREERKDMPVILMTSLGATEDVIAGLECGAEYFLTKPCDGEYLIRLIRGIVSDPGPAGRAAAPMKLEFVHDGRTHAIEASGTRVLRLLLSTYEGAVEVNRRLAASRQDLEKLTLELETKVEQRTAALTEEVAERKRAQEALRRSEEKYRYLVENTSDVIYTIASGGIVSFVNNAAERLSGRPIARIVGRHYARFVHPEDRAAVREHYRNTLLGREEPMECRIPVRSGGIRWVRFRNRPILQEGRLMGVHGSMTDITEQRKLEEQFLHAQKMEAMGRLASGIAHDFNNILMAIRGFTEILLKRLSPEEAGRSFAQEIGKAAERAIALTGQLLAFSRKQELRCEVVNLNTLIADAVEMLKRVIGEDVRISIEPDPLQPLVKSDRNQLVQVLMNLAVNARDAMPNGGILTIATSVSKSGGGSPVLPDPAPGDYAVMTVADTGTGMTPEALAHLFEPFFTTKEKGKGTGLGLATVYGIVNQSGGHVACASELGKGTVFTVRFPLVGEA